MAILRPATSRALLVKIIIRDHSQFRHVQMICILLGADWSLGTLS